MKSRKKYKMYLIAKIWQDHQAWNEEICSYLQDLADIFIPHRYNPFEMIPSEIPGAVYRKDLSEIMASDFGLILPPYGNDCSYEVGVYTGMGKPVIAFTRNETSWLKDWMVKGGITCAITDNPKTYEDLMSDHVLTKSRTKLVSSLEELPEVIDKVISKFKRRG